MPDWLRGGLSCPGWSHSFPGLFHPLSTQEHPHSFLHPLQPPHLPCYLSVWGRGLYGFGLHQPALIPGSADYGVVANMICDTPDLARGTCTCPMCSELHSKKHYSCSPETAPSFKLAAFGNDHTRKPRLTIQTTALAVQ